MGEYIDAWRYRKEGYGISRKLTRDVATNLIKMLKAKLANKEHVFDMGCKECENGYIYTTDEKTGLKNSTREACGCIVDKDSLSISFELLQDLGLSEAMLRKYKIEDWQEDTLKFNNLVNWVTDKSDALPRWVYIHGEVGAGKTFIAVLILLLGVLKEKSGLFCSVAELMEGLRPESEERNELRKKVKEVDILVLDDIGKEKVSVWVREQLHIIVDYRYRNGLMTVFTSNIPVEKVKINLSEAIYSRIKGEADLVKLGGEDKRNTKNTPIFS